MKTKKILLIGATGMVGSLALRDALRRLEVGEITAIGRRSTGNTDAKLNEVLHQDFTDYHEITETFENQDIALFCLGVYTGGVPDPEFRKITVDYTVAFAEALRARSPEAVFCFLSGQGADRSEKSRVAFARYKGMAENALLGVGFPRVHIFRPGYIYPVEPRREPNVSYRVLRRLYPVLRRLYPNVGLASDDLGRAMVHAGLHGTDGHAAPILENRDIRTLVERIRS